MKIRTDFVTNSSSSSFLLARKGELTKEQKEAIVSFVEERLFGDEVINKENYADYLKENYLSESCYDAQVIRDALDRGMEVHSGSLDFEKPELLYSKLLKDLWDVIEKAGPETFKQLDTCLEY